MAISLPRRALWAAAVVVAWAVEPAAACTTCSCGLPGSGTEVSSISGSATLFATGGRFLVQSGVSLRDVTGSFNERGAWTEKPQGSSLLTLQGNMGLTWYPTDGWTLGLQLPVAFNRLNGAQWGGQGSISPVGEEDGLAGVQQGGGLGDVALQASAVAYPGDDLVPSLALWSGLSLPSGHASGAAAGFTGSGVASGQLGLSVFKLYETLELTASLGYQQPLTRPLQALSSAFYVGSAAIAQLQANWEVLPSLRLGLGATAFRGWVSDPEVASTASELAKLKLIPSVEWRFLPEQGLRFAYGADPGLGPWQNAMTDQSVTLVYFQYL